VKRPIIDFCLGWGPEPEEPFLEMLREACQNHRLNFFVCRDEHVDRLIRGLDTGKGPIRLYLNADGIYEDPERSYTRLGFAVHDSGGVVVNEPDQADRSANKAIIHYDFEKADIPTPNTVVVRNWEPKDFRLTVQERNRLGNPFIVKPARGYGKKGVVKVKGSGIREIARARTFDRGDDFLIQEIITPDWFEHRRAWFRVYVVMGEVIPCWWDHVTEHSQAVTLEEYHRFGLAKLADIALRISSITRMNFFSTEIAITQTGRRRRFVSIDYVNDPCDMTLQGQSHCGVPEPVVRRIAGQLAETAWRLRRGRSLLAEPRLWFVS
jgi:hypothetical protein